MEQLCGYTWLQVVLLDGGWEVENAGRGGQA